MNTATHTSTAAGRTARLATHALLVILLSALAASFGGCRRSSVPSGSAMYYWKPVFELDSVQLGFIGEHDIKALYIRFFDICLTDSTAPAPMNAIRFKEKLPENVDYVPVVHIATGCFESNRPQMARTVMERVREIASANGLAEPKEIQIDYDWTESTHANYLTFMDSVCANAKEANMRVSVTVRLHRLADKAPSADYGVLMVFNTSDVKNADDNPILTYKSIEPCLGNLKDYALPLCSAYPNFCQTFLYNKDAEGKNRYGTLIPNVNPAAQPFMFEPVDSAKGEWETIRSLRLSSANGSKRDTIWVEPGEKVIVCTPPSFDQMVEIEKALGENCKGINSRVILYDISTINLNIYTSKEYKKIFHP